jgi:hypothetical protein
MRGGGCAGAHAKMVCSSRGSRGRLGLAIRGGDAAAAGGHAGERGTGEKEGHGFIGARRTEIWQAGSRRRIGLILVLESGLPTGDEIGLTSRSHNLTKREERRGKERRKQPRVEI